MVAFNDYERCFAECDGNDGVHKARAQRHLDDKVKVSCNEALSALWAYFEAYAQGADVAIQNIAVLLTTTDVALKLFGGLASKSMPAARVAKAQRAHALLMDEVQRVPLETFLALALQVPTVCAFGDRSQKCHSLPLEGFNIEVGLAQTNILDPKAEDPTAIDHLLAAHERQAEGMRPASRNTRG